MEAVEESFYLEIDDSVVKFICTVVISAVNFLQNHLISNMSIIDSMQRWNIFCIRFYQGRDRFEQI